MVDLTILTFRTSFITYRMTVLLDVIVLGTLTMLFCICFSGLMTVFFIIRLTGLTSYVVVSTIFVVNSCTVFIRFF